MSMLLALEQFRVSIARVRDLIALHHSINAQSTNALDLSDILRSALVLSVSALDYYVHEVVTLGMLEIYRGQRPEPQPSRNSSQSAFSRFQISLGGAKEDRRISLNINSWLESDIQDYSGSEFLEQPHLISELIPIISDRLQLRLSQASWLESEIRQRLSYQSFQQPDKIADALRLISDKKLWDEVSERFERPAKEVKQQLIAIVDRRNKIAHEADIDPTFNIGNRWSIDEDLVTGAVDFIEQLVEGIHDIL